MAESREEKDRLYLQESDQFRRFLRGLHDKREAALSALSEADDVQLRKLAGQITALTDILGEFDYDHLRR